LARGSATESGVSQTGAARLAVLIVGMHRSGTSALSGMLNSLGVTPPSRLFPADEHNPRGYFEPELIIDFHERLFAQLGSPSNDPLPLSYDWVASSIGTAAAAELAGLLDQEFADKTLCLFKDPRICRLMPVWSAALAQSGIGSVAILPYRYPLDVAGSLAAKAGLGTTYSLFMWLQHVLAGERFTRAAPRSFVGYDDLIADWRAVAAKLKRELGLGWPRAPARAGDEIDDFLASELRHHEARSNLLDAEDPLHGLCIRAWRGLQRLAADPYDREAMEDFDALWGEFIDAVGICGPLVVEFQRSAATALARAAQVFEDGNRAIEDAVAHRIMLEGEIDAKNREIDVRGGEIERLQERLQQIESSLFWRVSGPLRRVLARHPAALRFGRGALGRRPAPAAGAPPPAAAVEQVAEVIPPEPLEEIAAAAEPAPSADEAPDAPAEELAAAEAAVRDEAARARVLFLSGEPDMSGGHRRVRLLARAARRLGAVVAVMKAEDIGRKAPKVWPADLMVIRRAAWTPELAEFIGAARAAGAQVAFDFDELPFDPDRAAEDAADDGRRLAREILEQADVYTAPTLLLADQLRRLDRAAFVLPDSFDEDELERSRLAVRRRRAVGGDGQVRIGYVAPFDTRQDDFAVCADAVAEVLRAHPETRLVLFRDAPKGSEDREGLKPFPQFAGLEAQIEWRETAAPEALPEELARLDVNIVPRQAGDLLRESTSAASFLDAALVDAPTLATPTDACLRAIKNGETGVLAADADAWREALMRLVADAALRRRIGAAAFRDALAKFGPEPCADAVFSLLEQVIGEPRRGARAFELELARGERPETPAPVVPEHAIVFERDSLRMARASVVVPLFNYAGVVEEALESVRAQTFANLDLIVVDDASTDDSLAVAQRWLEANASSFNRVALIRNLRNSGLAFTRNVGFANAETPYVLPLDADNRLRPECVERLLAEIEHAYAAFAYPRLREFEESAGEANTQDWLAARLTGGNFVDALALVRRSAWAAVGGYDHVRHGWEDYDFWCRLVERGMFGVRAPFILAEYRVHGGSMLRTETELAENKLRLIADMEQRHPWLRPCRPARQAEATA
jgi:GT2 family glycosyltransferase/glycosyltransferase involved in cell wall biosynthesis